MATNQISITVSEQEREKLEGRAKKSGQSLSAYIRKMLRLKRLKHGDEKRFKRKAAEQPTEGRNETIDNN